MERARRSAGRRLVTAGQFARVPGDLFGLPLTTGAKLTYCVILLHAWKTGRCFPSEARLAELVSCGRRSLVRYLEELRAAGVVAIDRAPGRPSVYRVLNPCHFGTGPPGGHANFARSHANLDGGSCQNRHPGEIAPPPHTPPPQGRKTRKEDQGEESALTRAAPREIAGSGRRGDSLLDRLNRVAARMESPR